MKTIHRFSTPTVLFVTVIILGVTLSPLFGSEVYNPNNRNTDAFKFTFIEDEGLAKDMISALKIHEEAKNFEDEQKAASAFVDVMNKYPSEWLPAYWASYLHTQLTNIIVGDISVAPEGTTIEGMISKSQNYLDIAKDRIDKMAITEQTAILNLQALIYFFKARTSENEEGKNNYLAKRTESVSRAISLDPENPNSQVLAATELIRYGYNEKDLQKVLGGKLLLEKAKITYENDERPRAMTTHWAKDFVSFWLGFANKTIDEYSNNVVNNSDE